MKLLDILQGIDFIEIIGNEDVIIDNLSQDTRENFTKHTSYFAVKGTQVDGHNYIVEAIEKGAQIIFCEHLAGEKIDNITYVILDSVIQKMGYIVSNFYENPSHELKIIAVTGTNGKTTIATALYQSL
jgi:UDP-N-acetylmuramoyl-L-alanyl-D-glutamate--2,6-diaminopimelate ligase